MKLFRHELRIELLLYTRSRELAFFTFLLPLILFVLLGSVYGNDTVKGDPGVKQSKYLEAGMIGYGAISIAFAGLAIVLVIRRESGVLKRLRATPLPAWAYIAAVLCSYVAAFAVRRGGVTVGECGEGWWASGRDGRRVWRRRCPTIGLEPKCRLTVMPA